MVASSQHHNALVAKAVVLLERAGLAFDDRPYRCGGLDELVGRDGWWLRPWSVCGTAQRSLRESMLIDVRDGLCESRGIDVKDVLSSSRHGKVVCVRRTAAWAGRRFLGVSLHAMAGVLRGEPRRRRSGVGHSSIAGMLLWVRSDAIRRDVFDRAALDCVMGVAWTRIAAAGAAS